MRPGAGARAGLLLLLLLAGCGGRGGEDSAIDPATVDLRPAGAREVLAAVEAAGARAVLLNIWATWCVPCREEFPDLMRLEREFREEGLALVLVSADFENQAAQARDFLAQQGVDFPSYLKTGKDMEFIDTLDPRWSGALPATWIFDDQGRVLFFWEDRAPYETMRERVLEALRGEAAPPHS